jgi:putative FmdB family regulatory protein
MPLYEYQCTSCGHRFEVIQKFSDPQIKKCPKCGKAVERLVSSPAIQFKGTGWYVTDYGRGSGPASEKPSSGGKSERGEGKESVTEASAPSEKSGSSKETSPTDSPAPPKKD